MIAHLEFTNEFLIFDQQSTDKPQATQSLLSFEALGSFDSHFDIIGNLILVILSTLARV